VRWLGNSMGVNEREFYLLLNRPAGLRTESVLLIAAILLTCCIRLGAHRAKRARLMTRWSKDVGPANPPQEYPGPELVGKGWLSLNGV
jgi:hypothetical protein